MLDIYNNVEDLRCLNNGDEVVLKEKLKEEFLEFCGERNINFTWVSDRHIMIDDEEEEYLEDDIVAMLQGVYEDYLDEILGEEE